MMKNVKTLLPLAAFVLAIAGAFASIKLDTAQSSVFLASGGSQPCDEFDPVACSNDGSYMCTVQIYPGGPAPGPGTYQVYEENLGVSCVNALTHYTPEPFVYE